MVQDAATAKEHQVDARARARWRGRDDDDRALSVRPLQEIGHGDACRITSRRAVGARTAEPTLGHGGQPVGGDRREAGEGGVRHESGESRRAEAAVVDRPTDGLLKLFQMVGVCCQW